MNKFELSKNDYACKCKTFSATIQRTYLGVILNNNIVGKVSHIKLIYSVDLPQVFKPTTDRSSIRLSFCSLPAKIPLLTFLAGLLLFLFDGLQVI